MNFEFEESKKFGDKLEKGDAIKLIKMLHPKGVIKDHSYLTGNPNTYRISVMVDGKQEDKAVPDHIVLENNKIVAMYDSKNKKKIYNVKGHEPFFSTDEKHLDYQYFAEKYNVPCCLIFYCAEKEPEHFYVANVHDKPKFYKEINNRYGRHWFGYYVSQCKQYKKNIKHTENFNTEDVFKIVKIAYQDFNQALDMAWKIRNQWLENIQGRADYLKNSLDNFSSGLRNARTANQLMKVLVNFEQAGKKNSMACSQAKGYF